MDSGIVGEGPFLVALYDALKGREESRRFPWNAGTEWLPSRDQLHPAQPRFQEPWRWQLHGSRESWWLTIVDPRYPGPEYPWRVRPQGDPGFFSVACEQIPLMRDIETFIEVVMVTRMGERDLGHTNAETAYSQGAVASDPPWVSTAMPHIGDE